MASAARRRVDDSLVLEAASRLTERDRYLCRLLLDHQVLTTHQIEQIGFSSQRRTRFRLEQLYKLRILDRFRPLVASGRGSAPHHWILDSLGAAVLAAERGVDVTELPWRRDKAVALATNSQLRHLVGVNSFFCSLLATARRQAESDLVLWWPARRCAGAWGEFVRPDGYAVWAQAGQRVAFLLEHDTGSEPTARLADKADRYARLFAATGRRIPVLFDFPTPGRETEARKALRHPDVPIATSSPGPAQSAADPIWLPVDARSIGGRRRIIDLADRGARHPDGAR